MGGLDVCPICQQPGGLMLGQFHGTCWSLMMDIEPQQVMEALPETLEIIARSLEETATALRAVHDPDVLVRLGQACMIMSVAREADGAHLMNLHQYRLLLTHKRAMMN